MNRQDVTVDHDPHQTRPQRPGLSFGIGRRPFLLSPICPWCGRSLRTICVGRFRAQCAECGAVLSSKRGILWLTVAGTVVFGGYFALSRSLPVSATVALILVVALRSIFRRSVLIPPYCCPKCGYDWSHVPGRPCPECGRWRAGGSRRPDQAREVSMDRPS